MIQNHSDHDFNFGLDGSDIDGFQITIYSGGTCIAAGKKGVAKFHFREQDLTDYGINDFQVLNTTFSELYKKGEEEEYLEYRDSLFCKEIHRKFPVFVIDWREDVKEKKRIVNDIFLSFLDIFQINCLV